MSHTRGARHQKLKHHVRQRVRQFHRMATIAATMTAAAAPAAHVRADGKVAPASARAPRATMPLSPAFSAAAPVATNIIPPTTAKRTAPTTTASTTPVAKTVVATRTAATTTVAAQIKPVATTRVNTPAQQSVAVSPLKTIPVITNKATTTTISNTTTTPATTPSTPSIAKTPPEKPIEKSTSEDQALLAQLDKELQQTETKLKTTGAKLSDGQRELLGLSNTLRSVMLEDGANAAGLHPFVRIASRYAGTPYVWGGESRYGFDCSGFIIRVMRDLGYKALPHSAAEQFTYGQPVARSLLRPGDLVFFANTYKPGISHVGIYIGKGRFIHAASTRQGTIVSHLDASPYRQKYAGARRLVAARKA